MNYSNEDINYIKGFDHGCDYIVAEIKRYIKSSPYEPDTSAALLRLLAHLMSGDEKTNTRENT
jgi:hypothetical protein